ncbi:MAG TPA: hypothetical protein VFQ91_23195 [Bryobacteraceae bacterium]|nr:hypothetical protein [Bryobacteraceae bacterium]
MKTIEASAPVANWIDAALVQAQSGSLASFIDEFRLAACLGICRPDGPHAPVMQSVLPILRQQDDVSPWFDFLFELQYS